MDNEQQTQENKVKKFLLKNKKFLIISTSIILSIVITTIILTSILIPATGAAFIKLPFYCKKSDNSTASSYHYSLTYDYIGHTLNMRDYVKTNSKTNFILSSSRKKSDEVEDCLIKLKEGSQKYYIICNDSTGIRNIYELIFNVEYKRYNFFYTIFDEDALMEYYVYTDRYYDQLKFATSMNGFNYRKKSGILEPYEYTTQGDRDKDINYPHTYTYYEGYTLKVPTREGYKFVKWIRADIKYPLYRELDHTYVFVAEWEQI